MGTTPFLWEGRTVGIVSDNLYLAEEQKDDQNKDLRLINAPTANDHPKAFRTQQVDFAAVASWEPVHSFHLAVGDHDVFPDTENSAAIPNVLFVQGEKINSNGRYLVGLYPDCLRASDYAAQYQREVFEHLAPEHQRSPKLINQVTRTIHSVDLADNQRLLEPSARELQQQLKLMGRQVQQPALLNRFTKPILAWDNGIVNQLKG